MKDNMVAQKKIFVLVTNDLVQDQRMHRICVTLLELGFDVHFIGRERQYSKPLLDLPFKQFRISCSFESGPLFYLEYNLKLRKKIKAEQPDYIYAVDFDTMPSLLKIVDKKKIIFDAHEDFTEVPELKGKWLKKNLWKLVGNYFIPKCNLWITVNNHLATKFSRQYDRPFHSILNAPTLKTNEKSPNRTSNIVLYQGVLNKGRGLHSLIDAMTLLPEKVKLWIIGEGDLSEELRLYARQSEAKNQISFLGWKTPEELQELTPKAAIGVNLLDDQSESYKFSLANKFFDYIHAELPSIHMNFPVYKEMNEEYKTSVLIKDLQPQTISDAIISILENENLYEEMVKECKNSKLKYNWENEAQKLKQLLLQIM